jgi:NADPH2:quinone reductase
VKDPPAAFKVQNAVFKLLDSKKVTPVTFEPVYEGLDKVSQGLQDLEGRKTWGKAVIRVRDQQGKVVGGASERGVKAKL